MRIGSHVPSADPRAEAAARDAEVVQIFLSAPRAWKPPRTRPDAAELAAGPLPVYVHAPYLINLASGDEVVRERSLTALQATCDAAATVGALGVVVHGGQVPVDEDASLGPRRWRTALEQLRTTVPVLVENTAGGGRAVAREVEAVARLWAALDGVEVPLGFCLDTCHLHAAGEQMLAGTERLVAELGRIDLTHVNDSRDPAGSRRDRHANLGAGELDPDLLVAVVRTARADAVVETPGGAEQQAADVTWLRDRLAG